MWFLFGTLGTSWTALFPGWKLWVIANFRFSLTLSLWNANASMLDIVPEVSYTILISFLFLFFFHLYSDSDFLALSSAHWMHPSVSFSLLLFPSSVFHFICSLHLCLVGLLCFLFITGTANFLLSVYILFPKFFWSSWQSLLWTFLAYCLSTLYLFLHLGFYLFLHLEYIPLPPHFA